jgi:uncharacterized repeat protein (TIGR02543 family)
LLFAIWDNTYHTVTFAQNDNGPDPVYATQTQDAPTSLVPFSSFSPKFTNPGHTFLYWNTQLYGSGTSFTDGATFNFFSAIILYAQWSPNQYVVTLSPNGGSVNVASSTYTYGGTALTLPTPTNANAAFNGWYSALTGGTLIGAAGASYSPAQSLTLYAQWSPNQYVVTLSPNGGSVNVASSTYTYGGTALTLPTPTNANAAFNGWYSALTGGTLIGAAGASYSPAQSLTLYAQWTALPLIAVSFASNGGSGLVNAMSGLPNTSVTLPSSSNLARQGYNLSSWNAAPDGTGTSYALGQSVTLSTSLTLYAQWTALSTIELKFVTDGGSGSAAPLIGVVGANVALPDTTSVVKLGFTLTSWNTTANGTGTSFALGEGVTLSRSLTLYAQWKGTRTAVLYGAVGLFTKSSTKLTPSLKTQIQELAKTIKAKKYKKVTLFGYSVATHTTSLDREISAARATVVADFLRSQLQGLKVPGITITAAGEGSIAGKTAPTYARVEVFVL